MLADRVAVRSSMLQAVHLCMLTATPSVRGARTEQGCTTLHLQVGGSCLL